MNWESLSQKVIGFEKNNDLAAPRKPFLAGTPFTSMTTVPPSRRCKACQTCPGFPVVARPNVHGTGNEQKALGMKRSGFLVFSRFVVSSLNGCSIGQELCT